MNDEIVEHPFESELMLYQTDKDDVHVLNPTARVIYRHYKEGKGVEEIEKALREQFRIAPDRDIAKDIEECIAGLKKKGLIE